ncbi:hypothetical protein BRARA_I05409 [Brassica rapa]|uniref:Uncharacterized protein n=1 Tax=Brassica campestris TaxID=3711 RepID=A0A397Y6W3_BRACM|nr:hypothetical protein BRARA_I05409 [Brassica rapa]
MELEKEKKDPKEAKSNGKMKSAASIPANYVSILQLQERWMKDKERKQKEREIVERGVNEKVNAVEEPRVKLKEMGYEVSAIVSKKDEDGGDSRKKKWSKKKVNKKNQGGPVEAVVKCGSNSPVKEGTQGEKIVHNSENAACNSIGVETQFKQRVEEGGRDRNVNGDVRLNSGKGYYRNQKHDWSSTRVIKATKTMVWVKKGGE